MKLSSVFNITETTSPLIALNVEIITVALAFGTKLQSDVTLTVVKIKQSQKFCLLHIASLKIHI
jgi:hypothetical protein